MTQEITNTDIMTALAYERLDGCVRTGRAILHLYKDADAIDRHLYAHKLWQVFDLLGCNLEMLKDNVFTVKSYPDHPPT